MPIKQLKQTKGISKRQVSTYKKGKSSFVDRFRKPAYQNGGEGMIRFCNDFVHMLIYPFGMSEPKWVRMGELPTMKHPTTGKSYVDLWEAQQNILREALRMEDGTFIYRLTVLCWQRGEGKCQEKGSKVLMFDGTIKKVEDVLVGDLLMGDDNTPRKVLSLANGKEELFHVKPYRGKGLVVTKDHILSLKKIKKYNFRHGKLYNDPSVGSIIDISVQDFQKKSKCFQNQHLLFKTAVDWPEQKVPIDPYFLGLWLGDGHSRIPAITTMDKEIKDYIHIFAKENGLKITTYAKPNNKASTYSFVTDRGKINPLLELLKENNLIKNKHVPQIYKSNSRKIRLQILAGLMDSDGYVNRNSIGFTFKSKTLGEGVAFLARSLGLHAEIKKTTREIKKIGFIGEYYRLYISGDCSIIPTRIPRKKCTPRKVTRNILNSTIKSIESVGEREYYGFMLDGNGRYITEDFTVTHNSVLACLIQLWKFMCFASQKIVLGANSKEQTKFVHFDIIRDIILNSPELLEAIGIQNVQEKEIRIRNDLGEIISFIRPISSFSGIMSNVTGYTFSEMFDMKNPKFFTQLDGSIRNIPNAIGTIDSTVSDKKHVLYQLYETALEEKTKMVYFSHRFSKEGVQEDYWNPNMTDAQLSDYRAKFPFGEFEKYFLNTWEAGLSEPFSKEMREETRIISYEGDLIAHDRVARQLLRVSKTKEYIEKMSGVQLIKSKHEIEQANQKIKSIKSKFRYVDDFYRITTTNRATMQTLIELGDMFDTDWAILAGLDFSDPLSKTTSARTILAIHAKGLIGSRSNKDFVDTGNERYVYFLLHLFVAEFSQLNAIKLELDACHEEYSGIDSVCSERYGSWDLSDWCTDREIIFEPIHPSYDRQRVMFRELYNAVRDGLYKKPTVLVPGSKKQDIVDEEMEVFLHNTTQKWFGSPEKSSKYGVQDDTMFAQGWSLYGGRYLTASDFRLRTKDMHFGTMTMPSGLIATY